MKRAALFLLISLACIDTADAATRRFRRYRSYRNYCSTCRPATTPVAVEPVDDLPAKVDQTPPNPFTDPVSGWDAWYSRHRKGCRSCRALPYSCPTSFAEVKRQFEAAAAIGWHLHETNGDRVWTRPTGVVPDSSPVEVPAFTRPFNADPY